MIEGTVQRSGNRVRVTAELIRARSEAPLWSKVYERDSQDVLVMQSEVAQAIVGEIKVRLTPQDEKHLTNARPVNPEAYDAYLLGEFHSNKHNATAIGKAIEYFQKAIRIDSTYAEAYAGLANGYIEQEVFARTRSKRSNWTESLRKLTSCWGGFILTTTGTGSARRQNSSEPSN